MRQNKFNNPIKAQAAIAYLISQGWKINLAEVRTRLGEDLKPEDWLNIANHCLDFTMNELAKDKVIILGNFRA